MTLGWLGVKGMAVEIPERVKRLAQQLFPDLEEGVSLEYTSDVDFNYNCLSWALGCNDRLFANYRGAFWKWPDIPDDTADGWAQLCEIHGFKRTTNAEFVVGYEKIAIFEDSEGSLHAARNDKTGIWKSKLGDWGPDIDHRGLEALEPAYGKVVIVLEKHRPGWETHET